MRVKTHHVAASLFAGAIFLSTMTWFSVQVPTVEAACGTGSVTYISSPSGGATVGGSTNLQAYSSSPIQPSAVTFALTAPTGIVLGDGVLQSSGPSNANWLFNWDSTTVPNGSYQLTAIAHFSTTSADCNSTPMPLTVYNQTTTPTQNPTLTVGIAPSTWQTLPGGQKSFTASGVYTNQFGSQSPINTASLGAAIVWATDAGTLSPIAGPATTLTAGQKTGNLHLGVNVTINGMTQHATAEITVTAPTTSGGTTTASPTPTPKPSPTPTPKPATETQTTSTAGVGGTAPLTEAETTLLTATASVFRPTTGSNSAPIIAVPILGCLKAKLGTDYTAISSGQTQPSADDRHLSLSCFSGSDRIPAVLAPVSPSHITELPEEKALLTIGSIKNQTVANKQGDKVIAILLSGTSTPNSSVFLYFFSDPMVLRAETDSHGKWSYVLQNPLKPGKHEVYAVAAKDSANFVRTSAIPISIAAAAAGSQDGSLVIEPRWQAAQVGYVAGAVLMVLTAIFLMFRLRRRQTPAALVSAVSAPMVTGVAPVLIQPAAPVTPDPPDHDVQV